MAPPPATAAPGDPFPAGPGLVFVAQGPARGQPTTLYEAVQGPGEITFSLQGTSSLPYNGMGFDTNDMYLYAIEENGHLLRIGQQGMATDLGAVGLPSTATYNFNQGTIGEGAASNILYVRQATDDTHLYAVNVLTHTSSLITLQSAVPNLSDIVATQGYLFGVYGQGHLIYRIDPNTGAVISFPAPATLPADPFGAQWVYGNGNLGISDNNTGRIYQIQLNNATSASPSATLISSTAGPASTQNDGASYYGIPTDLAISKTGPAEWSPGDTITYAMVVTNLGPSQSSGYIVNDALPDNLLNPTTSTPGCQITAQGGHNYLQCSDGPLDAASSNTITVTGTAPAVAGTDCVSGAITNTVNVLGYEADPDLTNNMATSTACPTGTLPPTFSISKSASVAAPNFVGPGDRVTYTVTVHNTGLTDYTAANPASFTDNLTNVLTDATLDPASITGGGQASGNTVTWSGPLAVGETHTVSYDVVVNSPDTGGNHVLTNAATPGPTGTCADVCSLDTPIAEFSLSKTAEPTSVAPGGIVTYALTVTNTGAVPFGTAPGDAPPAHVTDNLAGVLNNAVYNNDASDGGTLTGSTLAWDLSLPVGGSTTLSYSVTANANVPAETKLTNLAATGRYGSCTSAAACTTDTPVQGFTIAKTVSSMTAAPGDQVTYTVTVHNTSGADFTDANPASFTDDLSNVLNNATYNNDATNGATVTGTTLTWSGPLAADASITITYSVTVNDGVADGTRLSNSATPGEPGACAGSCTTSTTISSASPSPSPTPKPEPTKHEREHKHLPETGDDLTVPAAVGAGGLLLLGAGLIWWRRKGGQRH
ncbi:DUF6923 family protein [Kitasatospora sp. NPDC092948]|uniref:DUF6923 family protein n=1 Tax=Kitasatospora sp. NPDC092948 TaxID=3364088 RepID=UPI00381F1900